MSSSKLRRSKQTHGTALLWRWKKRIRRYALYLFLPAKSGGKLQCVQVFLDHGIIYPQELCRSCYCINIKVFSLRPLFIHKAEHAIVYVCRRRESWKQSPIKRGGPSHYRNHTSVMGISHAEFLLFVRKNPFNHFLAHCAGCFAAFRFPQLLYDIQVLLPFVRCISFLPRFICAAECFSGTVFCASCLY